MSFFNTKNKKNYVKDTRKTLDAKHNEMIDIFKEQSLNLDTDKITFSNNRLEYDTLLTIKKVDLTDDQLNRRFELEVILKKSENYINKIENNEFILDYFLDTSNILNNYYDNINSIAKNNKTNKINKIQVNSVKVEEYINKSNNFNRADYLDRYLKLTDSSYSPLIKVDSNYNICTKCNIKMTIIQMEAILVCEKCGYSDKIIIDSNKPNYKDPPPEISYFAYKRINHFLYHWSVITGVMYNLLVLNLINQKIYV